MWSRLRSFGARLFSYVCDYECLTVLQFHMVFDPSVSLKTKLLSQLKLCSIITGHPFEKVYELSYFKNFLRLASVAKYAVFLWNWAT